ncbi:unnamed protein product [Brassica oleracea var. botrytis]|uniref:Mind bomb SH3 repeat domain-containing protein n=1 Tax=Brassica oleracea TaxID=3712 RepID=A0A3P6DJ54_BRAOL|nr:unnamed protein product [Brassica oleracea]
MEKIDDFKVTLVFLSFFEYQGCSGQSLDWEFLATSDNTGFLIDTELLNYEQVGDWVRVKASVSSPKYGWEDITRNSIGVMHILDEDGNVGIAFCFKSNLFLCSITDIEKVEPFHVGQEIRMIPSITEPQLGWSNETPATIAKIVIIDLDGALSAQVTGRQTLWSVSPEDVELLSGFEVGDWVRSKPSLGTRPSSDWFSVGRESIAVVHSIQAEAGYLELACCFRKERWKRWCSAWSRI